MGGNVRKITVSVPATTANLGPGFDALGLSLDIWNRFEAQVAESASADDRSGGKVRVTVDGEGADDLPKDERNLVYKAILKGLKGQRPPESLSLRIVNRVPLSSGLGSSATAIVGGLAIASALRSSPMSNEEMIDLASDMEGHPDNVAPAILGGLVTSVVRRDGSVQSLSVSPPPELWVSIAVPDFYLNTRQTRGKLPERVTRQDAVFSLSRAAMWVAAATTGRLDVLRVATEDVLHQPYRKSLIPGLDDVFNAADAAGALGVALSGSGPSVAAFCTSETGEQIGDAMHRAFRKVGVTARIYVRRPAPEGVRTETVESSHDGVGERVEA